jgi:hypothetical protein
MLMESNSRNQHIPYSQDSLTQVQVTNTAKDEMSWITNESILRDEGALYGIASADITEKLQAIAGYYQTKKAVPLQKKEFIQQRIQELSLIKDVNDAEIERLEDNLEESKDIRGNMLPLLFQLLAVIAVCVFNFFLLQWWLSPVVKYDLICLGIYFAGLFSVYIGRGLSYATLEKENTLEAPAPVNGRIAFLKEFAVAAAVAVFICTLTSDAYPLKNNLAAAVIFFLLFLVGKVLVNTFAGFKEEAAGYFQVAGSRYRQRRQQRLLRKKNEKSTALLLDARMDLQEPETLIKKLEAEQEYKTRVFLSEYHLAVESRQQPAKLPGKQFA